MENAVWHLMCAAKKDGLAKARKGIMKIGKDRRVPMMEVYDLFAGTKKPEDVMKAATAGDLTEEQRKPNLFYAHLYLGLYYDMIGDKKKAIEHLKQASGKYKLELHGRGGEGPPRVPREEEVMRPAAAGDEASRPYREGGPQTTRKPVPPKKPSPHDSPDLPHAAEADP